MSVNLFVLSGKIVKVNPQVKGDRTSAVMIVQYGQEREHSANNPFVNALPIRVPHYKYDKVKSMLVEGQNVDITGHHQGVFKDGGLGTGNGFFNTELVADHISLPALEGPAPTAE